MESEEIWRDCKGYEGKYQVSNYGRVWSILSQRYLKQDINKNNYCRVNLVAKNGKVKKEYVHRLVALAFLANPKNYTEVHHKDTNPQNNRLSNLEWITHKNNLNQKERKEKISKKVMCVETNEIYNSIKEAAEAKKLQASHIGEVCSGKRKTHGGYRWRFVGGDSYVND